MLEIAIGAALAIFLFWLAARDLAKRFGKLVSQLEKAAGDLHAVQVFLAKQARLTLPEEHQLEFKRDAEGGPTKVRESVTVGIDAVIAKSTARDVEATPESGETPEGS